MTDISLDDDLVAASVRATGHAEKSRAVEEMVRLQLQLKTQRQTVDELWGSFQWQGDLEQSRLSRDFRLNDDYR